jgi:hypothetical protein
MNAYSDKRACERRKHTASIEYSYFNKDNWYEAQTLNNCDEGICFKSEVSLKTGATICVRAKNLHPSAAFNGDCRGLRSLTLAEAKWCKKSLQSHRKAGYHPRIEPQQLAQSGNCPRAGD